MCGIIGFIGRGGTDILSRMARAVIHRGPDDYGEWFGAVNGVPVSLGFRRLSILDIAGGAQPMATADGKLSVVFNGEIYNHGSLRRELEALGHVFRSDHSDTEVLLHGYRQWGDDVVDRLRGMFAFALVDVERARVLLARDPFAKKPLFYAPTKGGLVFASELRAMLCHPEVSGKIDRRNVIRYFALDYVPAPRSLYEGVHKVEGGSVVVYDIAARKLDIRRAWQFRLRPSSRPTGSPEDWAVELRRLLTAAVEKRLESDVPLGFFLSGGVDSASIVGLARRIVGNRPIKTFTIGFNETSYDESAAAREVARLYGTEHRESILDTGKVLGLVPQLLKLVHEPVADDALVPTYVLSREARKHVTVALSGDGGDEMFAGYDIFPALPLVELYHKAVPGWLHRILRGVADRAPISTKRLAFDFKLRRALRGLSYRSAFWNPLWIGAVGLEDLSAFAREALDPEDVFQEAAELWDGSPSESVLDRTLEFMTHFYLRDDLMPKVDTASMLCSLEVRSPFLDRNLAEFCAGLPSDVKIRGGVRKWLLKEAMAPIVPREILDRKKQGFSVPLIDWLCVLPSPDLGLAEDIGFDAGWLARAHAAHISGKADHRGLLWAWHCLEGSVKGNAEAVKNGNGSAKELAT